MRTTELDNIIKDNKCVFVDFFATWCGPCQMLLPILEKVELKYPDVKFVRIDVGIEPHAAEKYNVMSIPAVFFIKDGEVVDKFVGFKTQPQLEEFINKNKN